MGVNDLDLEFQVSCHLGGARGDFEMDTPGPRILIGWTLGLILLSGAQSTQAVDKLPLPQSRNFYYLGPSDYALYFLHS